MYYLNGDSFAGRLDKTQYIRLNKCQYHIEAQAYETIAILSKYGTMKLRIMEASKVPNPQKSELPNQEDLIQDLA